MPRRDLNPYQFEVAMKRNGFKQGSVRGFYYSTRPGDDPHIAYPCFLTADRNLNRRETLRRIINARLRNEAILSAADRRS